jgi:site-specific recombinase XerD
MNNSELPNPISFESAIEKFTTHLKSQKRSTATIVAYKGDLEQLKRYLSGQKITQATTVTPEYLNSFIASMNTGYTAKSVSRKINSLKTFFKFLLSAKLNPKDPSITLQHPKYETSAPRTLTAEECRALRDACRLDIRLGSIIEIMLQTGIKISELANLRVDDVKKTELHIGPLENNPARDIPLFRSSSVSIQNYLAIRPKVEDDHLFITKSGRPLLIRNIRTAIDRYFRIAGIKGSKVNDIRNTFVAFQLKAGVNLEYLSKIVGHKRLSSTSKYLSDFKPNLSPSASTKLVEL